MQRFYLIVFIGLCLLMVSCSASDSAAAYQPKAVTLEGDALKMLDNLNAFRMINGLAPLQGEERLMIISQGKAQQMFDGHTIDHSGSQERIEASGAMYQGECISYNYLTVGSELLAYEDSKSHMLTLVNPNYTHMGYGKAGQYGCLILAGYAEYSNGKKVFFEEVITAYKGGVVSSVQLIKQ